MKDKQHNTATSPMIKIMSYGNHAHKSEKQNKIKISSSTFYL